MKKILSMFLGIATMCASFAFVMPVLAVAPGFDTTGSYIVAMEYLGTNYSNDMNLIQDNVGQLTGNGGSPAGANVYLWTINSGTVAGNAIEFTANYTATPDAVTPQAVITASGTVALDGTMTGTWSDNYAGGERSGTWTTTSGNASPLLLGALAAEDFSVASYDTGLGILSGYTAGFGLADATFANATSVVVQLFAGATLLQTNTATPKLGIDVTGSQISSPFDVSGTFNYAADGYWINTKATEYGQSVPATTVVASVTLENGKMLTATNTALVGNPTTIYPVATTSPTATVTILKFVQGVLATATTADSADFPMTASWDASNIGAGTGEYTLSEASTVPYQAVTVPMTKGATYATAELLLGDTVAAACELGTPFALQGYTTGDTLEEAMTTTSATTSSPSFSNIQNDKYVIVWNRDCALPEGNIGGTVVPPSSILAVTSIEMIDTSATANGAFADGWKYVFHVTASSSEQNLAMKFSDWLRTDGSGSIPVAGNMRISSPQANNGGATILLTGANTYSSPALFMIGDINPLMNGRQVDITVEVAVPEGTPSGAYSTNYGVRSNP